MKRSQAQARSDIYYQVGGNRAVERQRRLQPRHQCFGTVRAWLAASAAILENVDFDISASDSGIAISPNPARLRNVRILIADDNPTIMGMVKKILNARPEFDVVGEASDGQQAVILAESLKPDAIVINVPMPKMSGFEAARRPIKICNSSQRLGKRERMVTFKSRMRMANSSTQSNQR